MRRAIVVAALLAAGCAVPHVAFYDDGADGGGPEGGVDATTEATSPEASSEAQGDALPASDAPFDGSQYCNGNPAPDGGMCCTGGSGPVCFGGCTKKACTACTATGPCESPSVCCTSGNAGVCQLPPC
jgi:hypothetical protein